jgi:hypothetical protein
LALVLLIFSPLFRVDLDVGVPPGTPLDWAGALPRPSVPTYAPMATPTESSKPKLSGGTVAENLVKPIPSTDYGTVNIFDMLAITTIDFQGYMPPPTDVQPKVDDAVATGEPGALPWPYPPPVSMELYWQGCCAAVRAELRGREVSVGESIAYCLLLGVPAIYGARGGLGGPVLNAAQKYVVSIPKDRPAVPDGRTPREGMICRLAAIELTTGFAHPAGAECRRAPGRVRRARSDR